MKNNKLLAMALIIMGSANANLIEKGKQAVKNVISNKKASKKEDALNKDLTPFLSNKKRLDLVAELQKERETDQSAWAKKKDEYRSTIYKLIMPSPLIKNPLAFNMNFSDLEKLNIEINKNIDTQKVERDLSDLEKKIEKLNIEITKGLFKNSIQGLFKSNSDEQRQDWLDQLQKEKDLCQIELNFQQDELDRQKDKEKKREYWGEKFPAQDAKIAAKIKKLEGSEIPKLKIHMVKLNEEMAKLKNQ
jgi:hypothetical protein